MIGLLGIGVSLLLLMFFAYRGLNVIILAPICALIALVFQPELGLSNFGSLTLATYTEIFINSLTSYVAKYFAIFLLGAIFGKLMASSGAAKKIGLEISKVLGPKNAILVGVLACAILTYGGVSLFVVAFCIYPIIKELYIEAQIELRFVPATIALGSFTFTMTALPGTPAIQNAIPMPYFGTTSFAAPMLGTIAAIFIFTLGLLWLKYRVNHSPKKSSIEIKSTMDGRATQTSLNELKDASRLPHILLCIAPLLIVVLLNYLFSEHLIPSWELTELGERFFGLKLSKVKGLWSLIIALSTSIIFMLFAFKKWMPSLLGPLNEGTFSSFLPIFNTASEVGYGAVISGLSSFTILKNIAVGLGSTNPLLSMVAATNLLAGITGSASGGMSIALEILGAKYLEQAQALNISAELLHRVVALSSGGLDTLPHNGAVITLLAICSMTHKKSYFDIFIVAVVLPFLSCLLVVLLGSFFGSF